MGKVQPCYRLFRAPYNDKITGKVRLCDAFSMTFRDHLKRRQTIGTLTADRDKARKTAERVMELVECRREGTPLPSKLRQWVETRPPRLRRRLLALGLIAANILPSDTPLLAYLDGHKDERGAVTKPGWKQAITAKGSDANRAHVACSRVRAVLEACGFVHWRDLIEPGAETAVQVWLAGRRDKGEIRGATVNKYVADLQSFCRWLHKNKHAPDIAMAGLELLANTDIDSEARRALTTEEMHWLLRTTAAKDSPVIQGLTGDERAFLYRVAFETGIRPGQLRVLTVKDFDLDADPPTVTTHAKYVKRRRTHTQVLKPALATVLRERFKGKMPAAAAVKMPGRSHLAEMLRRDLARARAAWIDQKGITDEEREQRQRSDFLADVNHQGEKAVFYSTRHGHGTALADAGVPEKDIARSMHHASRTTTARYLHGDRRSAARAVAALPDLSYPEAAAATGTHGPEPEPRNDQTCAPTCASRRSPMESGGVSTRKGGDAEDAKPSEKPSESRNPGEKPNSAPWRNWQTRWIQNPLPARV